MQNYTRILLERSLTIKLNDTIACLDTILFKLSPEERKPKPVVVRIFNLHFN